MNKITKIKYAQEAEKHIIIAKESAVYEIQYSCFGYFYVCFCFVLFLTVFLLALLPMV